MDSADKNESGLSAVQKRTSTPFALPIRLLILFSLGAYTATFIAQGIWGIDSRLDQVLGVSAILAGLGIMARLFQFLAQRRFRTGIKIMGMALVLSFCWGFVVLLFLLRIGILGELT